MFSFSRSLSFFLSLSLSLENGGNRGTRGNRIRAIGVQGVILLMFLLNVSFVALCLNDITYELGGKPARLACRLNFQFRNSEIWSF